MSPLVITMLILLFAFIALLSGHLSYGVVAPPHTARRLLTRVLYVPAALAAFPHP